MRKTNKLLEEYQIEINDLEMEALQTASVEVKEMNEIEDQKELESYIKKSFEGEFKITALRKECIANYGEKSLWPTEQTPSALGGLIVMGLIKSTDVSLWFGSAFNTFRI